MSDDPTIPPSTIPPPPSRGIVPGDITGVFYSKGWTIFLSIITLGVWSFLWIYRSSEDLKKYNGDGLGGVLAVVIHLLVNIVLWFTIPNEIKNMYEREGRPSPVSAIWGLWFLLPIVGAFIWYFKVQNALNDFWASKGANTAKA